MGLATDGYYSFDDLGGGWNGLVRVSGGGAVLERVTDGEWVADQDLGRHFVDPGSSFLEPIKRSLATKLAEQYGVEL